MALQARLNLLHLILRDVDERPQLSARFPAVRIFGGLDDSEFIDGAEWLEARSLQLRARSFLSSAELRQPGLSQEYFEAVAQDPVVRTDAALFLQTARHLESPMTSVAMKKSPLVANKVPILRSFVSLSLRAPSAVHGDGVSRSLQPRRGISIVKNARERMDVLAAYRDVGTYRGASVVCALPTRR